MRVFSQSLVLGVLALCLSAATVMAQDYSTVPTAREQITDAVFQDALAQYSPNYNYLTRDEQIRAYVNIYQALYGTQPSLSTQDAAYLSQQVYVVDPAPQTYYYSESPTYYYSESPGYYYDSRPGFSLGISIGNDRWGNRGWNRPGSHHRPPNYRPGGSGRPGGPGRPGRPGGSGGPGRPGSGRPGGGGDIRPPSRR